MSERERWIVYPLLFFALGAAVRDKILHRVDAKEIYCESLKIVDQQNPTGRPLVELGIQRARSNDPTRLADRVGRLRLTNSNGRDVCLIEHEAVLPRVFTQRLDIVDERNQVRGVATTESVPGFVLANGAETMTSQGVIYLNNQRVGTIKLAPPKKRPATPNAPRNPNS